MGQHGVQRSSHSSSVSWRSITTNPVDAGTRAQVVSLDEPVPAVDGDRSIHRAPVRVEPHQPATCRADHRQDRAHEVVGDAASSRPGAHEHALQLGGAVPVEPNGNRADGGLVAAREEQHRVSTRVAALHIGDLDDQLGLDIQWLESGSGADPVDVVVQEDGRGQPIVGGPRLAHRNRGTRWRRVERSTHDDE